MYDVLCWQVCCASEPSVICTGVVRGLGVKAAWLHSGVCICLRKRAPGRFTIPAVLLNSTLSYVILECSFL